MQKVANFVVNNPICFTKQPEVHSAYIVLNNNYIHVKLLIN